MNGWARAVLKKILPRPLLAALLAALLGSASLTSTLAQPADRILIGMTAPLSGTASASYGQGLELGVQLAIARANAAGGVDGHRLELVSLNDKGDPELAASNARELMRRGVVALVGAHGARPVAAVADVLAAAGAAAPPLVGPATSAESLREPPRAQVFHLRGGTSDEMNAAMLHLDTIGLTRYALLVQEGVFGESARSSLELQLMKIAMRPVASRSMARIEDSRPALAALCASAPQVIVLAVDEALAVAAIEAGRSLACSAQYLVLSETGAAMAERSLAGKGRGMAGLLVTQVVPHPANLAHPLIAEYQKALALQDASLGPVRPGYPSIEGYQAMRVVHEALRACGRETTRACLARVLSSKTFEVAGQRIHFGEEHRQLRPFVEITLLDAQGRFRR